MYILWSKYRRKIENTSSKGVQSKLHGARIGILAPEANTLEQKRAITCQNYYNKCRNPR